MPCRSQIRALDARITIFTVPFLRFNLIPIGGRSTAVCLRTSRPVSYAECVVQVKLDTGNVVLFASHSGQDDATQTALKQMHGSDKTVSHIVALDAVHQLYLSVGRPSQIANVLPDACPAGLRQAISTSEARRT